MGARMAAPDPGPVELRIAAAIIALRLHAKPGGIEKNTGGCDNRRHAHCRVALGFWGASRQPSLPGLPVLATERHLADFLKSVDKRAFKRSFYHVRNEEAALDILQDSMLKLAEHYGDKPAAELPLLYQRILSNCTLDWFRRQKTRNALFSSMSDFEGPDDEGADFDLLQAWSGPEDGVKAESAADLARRTPIFNAIEAEK